MQKITPSLWFDTNAEDAANFYVSLFPDAKITNINHFGEGGPLPKGTVLTVTFTLFGQEFVALNGGPYFKFTPALSFVINCETQQEIDHYWEQLSAGGQEQQCGWLTDKYGLSWQIVPVVLRTLLSDTNAAKAQNVMTAMMKMIKLDIKTLEDAFNKS